MKLLVKKENQIFRKAVLHIEGCGEVIVKCVSAQRFSSTSNYIDLFIMQIIMIYRKVCQYHRTGSSAISRIKHDS
jgi:hypothetical protein